METKVGILGATGVVGQNYISLLEGHPWFEVSYVSASPSSAGKKYSEAVSSRWRMSNRIPSHIGSLVVGDASDVDLAAKSDVSLVFSALEIGKEETAVLEMKYAAAGIPVVSNSSAHRWTEDVPMIIPEINSDHLRLIDVQRENRGFRRGFVAVKPNCSIQSYLTPVYALMKAGLKINNLFVVTNQALSGAGYPGVPSMDVLDNYVPYIAGEEEKTEKEPLKVMGMFDGKGIVPAKINISAQCNRVPVSDGHGASVSMGFSKDSAIPDLEDVIKIWEGFQSIPQELRLPSAPEHPIIYLTDENRPQPKLDRYNEKGMAVTLGRLRECNVLDAKFVGLSHNTIRGAAGGAILTAELLYHMGYID